MNILSIVQSAEEKGTITRPLLCETCKQEKILIRHHRDYHKPLEITWLCYSCHLKEHYTNKKSRIPFIKNYPKRIRRKRRIDNCRLEGPVFQAFKAFCEKNSCQTSVEGVRALIRETDEYRRIISENENKESQA